MRVSVDRPRPSCPASPTVLAGDLVRRIVKKAPAGLAAATALDPVRQAWREINGTEGSIPLRISRDGVLTIGCSDAGLVVVLTSLREALLEHLVTRCPDAGVNRLRFSVADHAVSVPEGLAEPARPARPPRPPSKAQRAEADDLVGEITDPKLRELLARAAAASLTRPQGPPRR